MSKIRKGDEVIILTGRDRNRRGTVLSYVGKDRVLVEGINVFKKHLKANPKNNNSGGIEEKTMPIHISNLAIFNSSTGKSDRIGIRIEDGIKSRIFRSNSLPIDIEK